MGSAAIGERDSAQSRSESSSAAYLVLAGLLLGIGFGGFFDGILLHQILQWHHMLTSTGEHPATTVIGLEANTLADGLFHALTFVASLAGVFLLLGALRNGAVVRARGLIGLMLVGWGLFNVVEGLVNHQILTIHHVNYANAPLWDMLFLGLGAALLAVGWALARSRPPVGERLGSVEKKTEDDRDRRSDE